MTGDDIQAGDVVEFVGVVDLDGFPLVAVACVAIYAFRTDPDTGERIETTAWRVRPVQGADLLAARTLLADNLKTVATGPAARNTVQILVNRLLLELGRRAVRSKRLTADRLDALGDAYHLARTLT